MHARMHLIDNAYVCNLIDDKIMVGSTGLVSVPLFNFNHHTQATRTITVRGIVTTRYSHQSGATFNWTLSFTPKWKNPMLKKVATNVAGRNTIVRAAMVFMEALSRCVSSAIVMLVRESF
jgi:hypothetical protein